MLAHAEFLVAGTARAVPLACGHKTPFVDRQLVRWQPAVVAEHRQTLRHAKRTNRENRLLAEIYFLKLFARVARQQQHHRWRKNTG
jgi:hypothetical protein